MKQGVWRNPEMSKEDFMFYLFTKLGDENVAFAYNYKEGEDMLFSKWIEYKTIMETPHGCIVPRTRVTREEFVRLISHRTVLDIELMFDIDDVKLRDYEFPTIKDKARWILDELRSAGCNPTVYFTGNKSYHLSLIKTDFRIMHPFERLDRKRKILEAYGCDTQKAGRAMIAMENCLHYKSGKEKIEVEI